MIMVTTQNLSLHFKQPGHDFNKHVKSYFMEQINNTINTDIDTIKTKLRRREDFLILKRDTLTLEGLNEKLDNV